MSAVDKTLVNGSLTLHHLVSNSREMGLFGSETVVLGAGLSNAGRPRLPFRLMVSLLYLKHAYNESDEGLVERWSETPTWQYFSGMDYFDHAIDPLA